MITKAAHELLCKKSSLIPTLAGALREQKLTDTQRDTLRGQYGLKPDSNLMLRNVGRGLAGTHLATKKYSPANPLLKTDSLGGARQ